MASLSACQSGLKVIDCQIVYIRLENTLQLFHIFLTFNKHQHHRSVKYYRETMAAPQGPPRPPGSGAPIVGGRPLNQLSPEEIEKRMKEEAAKHGLTLDQFKQIQMMQQRRLEAEAAKHGMSPQQFMAMQQQKLQEEAAKLGMSPQDFIAMKQKEAVEAQRAAQQQAQQAQQNGQPPAQGQPQQTQAPQPGQPQLQRIDLNKPVEAKPDALAVAKFLRAQDLKCRTCIFDGQRKDMFKGAIPQLWPFSSFT